MKRRCIDTYVWTLRPPSPTENVGSLDDCMSCLVGYTIFPGQKKCSQPVSAKKKNTLDRAPCTATTVLLYKIIIFSQVQKMSIPAGKDEGSVRGVSAEYGKTKARSANGYLSHLHIIVCRVKGKARPFARSA